ncbi:hypothetical protein JTB14_034705 [Gonioctena quinquepunctata]|nr:hypothetical protein JTB14_034705 [Gonioctena quinquepunctata]
MGPSKQQLQLKENIHETRSCIGVRHIQYFFMFSCITLAYGMRTVLNVAIVEIINEDGKSSKDRNYPMYPEWADKKNIILSSFFWGYICLQLGAGPLAKNYGAKRFLLIVVFFSAIFGMLVPTFGSLFGYGGVMACRIAQGLCQGFMFPSVHTLLSKWAPISERAKWGGIVYAGQPVGNVLAMPITGAIAGSTVGWPAAFYLYGAFGFCWCILWIIYGSNCPEEHKSISIEERKFIESEIDGGDTKKVPTPWKAIFTSPPFLAILVTHCGQNWGFWTLLTEIPSYMGEVLDFKIQSNSLLSALPYFVMFILNIIMSPLADWLIKKNIVSRIASRKIFNSIGLYVPALALISLCFVGKHDKTLTVFILVIAVGFNAAQYCGFNVNHMDLSPVHAGVLMGITNGSSTVFSILAPLTVDAVRIVTGYEETQKELWNIVFLIAATFYAVVGTVFNIFGSGDLQPWNNPTNEVEKEKKEEERPRKSSSAYWI